MKKIFLALVPVALVASVAFKAAFDPLPIGSSLPNPERKMKDIAGKEVSFKDVMGSDSESMCPSRSGVAISTVLLNEFR